MTRLLIAAPVLLALTATGCGEPEYDTPTDEDYTDLADAVASSIGSDSSRRDGTEASGDVGSFSRTIVIAQGGIPEGMVAGGSGEITGTAGAFAYTYGVDCTDSSGAANDCGTDTTGAVASVDWTADLETPRFHLAADRSGTWTVQLSLTEATFAGEGHLELTSTFDAVLSDRESELAVVYDATYTDIVVPYDTMWPTSGQMTMSLDAQRYASGGVVTDEVDQHFLVDCSVSYAVDGTVTITLDGSHSYKLTLESGEVVEL